jgi:hypothetical protein
VQWFGHIERISRRRIVRRALKLKFKERDVWNNPEEDGFVRHCMTSGRKEGADKKIKDCGGEVRETVGCSSTELKKWQQYWKA